MLMRGIHWLLLLFTACNSASQNAPGTTVSSSSDKKIDTMHSKILNEDRFIWVHVPEAIRNATTKKFPVVFLFDAEANFDDTKNILDKLSKESAGKIADETILVGIGNIWLRYRDYSPSHVDSSPWLDDNTAKITGGGDAFISFIEKELLPFINKNYPVSSSRTIIGHSMGGLLVINILLKHQHLFDNYVAIDPSLWWDSQKLLKESTVILGNRVFENKSLFLAVANENGKRMDPAQIKNDTSAKTVLIRPSLSMIDHLQANKQNKLRFEWKFYKDDHHMSVNAPATYDALGFLIASFYKD